MTELADAEPLDRSCNVMATVHCLGPLTRGMCFACGLPACGNCSLRIDYLSYGKQRVCHSCINERFGDYDDRVFEQIHQLAGYPAGVGARVGAAARAEREARDAR